MQSALIIGSGPAATGAALALAEQPDLQITVIDIGGELEPHLRDARDRLAATTSDQWSSDDLDLIRARPRRSPTEGVPEKRAYGSNFPFRDFGQLRDVNTQGVHDALISGAKGGFSAVWGAQILPFPPAALSRWPVDGGPIADHYAAVLRAIPHTGEVDDLAEILPLHTEPTENLPLSQRATMVLNNYARHRVRLRRQGFVLGRSRLAVEAAECIRCGLCMSGCPYSLIYSTATTIEGLSRSGRIRYLGGLLAVKVSEDDGQATVACVERESQQRAVFHADRVFVACGAVGTTRLVLESLEAFSDPIPIRESAQLVVPLISRRRSRDPRVIPQPTLGELSAVLETSEAAEPLHVQIYTYDPSFVDALPSVIQRVPGASSKLLSRLSVAFAYAPSSASPSLEAEIRPPRSSGDRSLFVVRRAQSDEKIDAFRRTVLRRLLRSGPWLDLWPVPPAASVAYPGKSYHLGGSFPHRVATDDVHDDRWTTDGLGRLSRWKRIHVVDSAVFPTMASTTFALTIMANAHRIATAALIT